MSTGPRTEPVARVDSIDVFRGLTMFLMLFVNDLSDPDLGHVTDIPGWLRHMPHGHDGMTFVDVILPAFLFSAGLSLPVALGRRLAGASTPATLGHILRRSLGLILVGLGMVNTYRFHPTAMPISPAWWEFLFFLAVIFVWSSEAPVAWRRALKITGLLLLVGLAVIYRGSDGGDETWMRTSWWGILTMIGFAYLVTATCFVLGRGSPDSLIALLALLSALNIAGLTGALPPLAGFFPAGTLLGGLPSIMVAGAIAGVVMTGTHHRTGRLLALAAMFTAVGFLLYAPWGISKSVTSPAWCLLSAAICCALYALLHWLVDVHGGSRWAAPLRPAGRQPLLTYLLPHLFYSLLGIMGITWLEHHFNAGGLGIARSLALAALFIGLTHFLTRRRIMLRL